MIRYELPFNVWFTYERGDAMIYSNAFNDWFLQSGLSDDDKWIWAPLWNAALGTSYPSGPDGFLDAVIKASKRSGTKEVE